MSETETKRQIWLNNQPNTHTHALTTSNILNSFFCSVCLSMLCKNKYKCAPHHIQWKCVCDSFIYVKAASAVFRRFSKNNAIWCDSMVFSTTVHFMFFYTCTHNVCMVYTLLVYMQYKFVCVVVCLFDQIWIFAWHKTHNEKRTELGGTNFIAFLLFGCSCVRRKIAIFKLAGMRYGDVIILVVWENLFEFVYMNIMRSLALVTNYSPLICFYFVPRLFFKLF